MSEGKFSVLYLTYTMLKFNAFWVAVVALLITTAGAQWDPNVWSDRQVIVHLFEWKWDDIASECENFLGPRGYGGVQISPPNEHVEVYQGTTIRPWWERYQPVSYKIASRSGDETSFKDMVSRCNNAGVRIYVDAIINHMSQRWPQGTPATGGSYFDSGSKSYPAVPYTIADFNDESCYTSSGTIENYGDAEQVRNCKLNGLNDLNQGKEYVRGKIAAYLNKLIDWGVGGFRIDAAKHMWPRDMKNIFDRLNNLNTSYFADGSRPFIFQEVIDMGGEAITGSEYIGNGRVTEFKYGKYLGEVFRGNNQLRWLRNFGTGWGLVNRHNSVVFIDNHDNQRGHGAGGDQILTFRVSRWYKMANAFMLALPYGFTRVMSSYYWEQRWENGKDKNDWKGSPHDEYYNIISPSFNDDGSCGDGWICEHRWRQIYNMVEFRNVAYGTDMNDWWDNGSNQISFCRGNKGFIAINNDNWDLNEHLQTCLPSGNYCDVISGSKKNGSCTGTTIHVDQNGKAHITIHTTDYDGVIAIHANSGLSGRSVSSLDDNEIVDDPRSGTSRVSDLGLMVRDELKKKQQKQNSKKIEEIIKTVCEDLDNEANLTQNVSQTWDKIIGPTGGSMRKQFIVQWIRSEVELLEEEYFQNFSEYLIKGLNYYKALQTTAKEKTVAQTAQAEQVAQVRPQMSAGSQSYLAGMYRPSSTAPMRTSTPTFSSPSR